MASLSLLLHEPSGDGCPPVLHLPHTLLPTPIPARPTGATKKRCTRCGVAGGSTTGDSPERCHLSPLLHAGVYKRRLATSLPILAETQRTSRHSSGSFPFPVFLPSGGDRESPGGEAVGNKENWPVRLMLSNGCDCDAGRSNEGAKRHLRPQPAFDRLVMENGLRRLVLSGYGALGLQDGPMVGVRGG